MSWQNIRSYGAPIVGLQGQSLADSNLAQCFQVFDPVVIRDRTRQLPVPAGAARLTRTWESRAYKGYNFKMMAVRYIRQ